MKIATRVKNSASKLSHSCRIMLLNTYFDVRHARFFVFDWILFDRRCFASIDYTRSMYCKGTRSRYRTLMNNKTFYIMHNIRNYEIYRQAKIWRISRVWSQLFYLYISNCYFKYECLHVVVCSGYRYTIDEASNRQCRELRVGMKITSYPEFARNIMLNETAVNVSKF